MMEYRILWIRIPQFLNPKIGVFSNIQIRSKFVLNKREKCEVIKTNTFTNFAVALFVLLSKRTKETLNKLTVLRNHKRNFVVKCEWDSLV